MRTEVWAQGFSRIYREAQRKLKEWPEKKEAVLAWRSQVKEVFQEKWEWSVVSHVTEKWLLNIEEIA